MEVLRPHPNLTIVIIIVIVALVVIIDCIKLNFSYHVVFTKRNNCGITGFSRNIFNNIERSSISIKIVGVVVEVIIKLILVNVAGLYCIFVKSFEMDFN